MYRYNVTVTRIVDGDTVDVDIDLGFGMVYKKQRVRMMGIDTPESRTKDLEEKFYGKQAETEQGHMWNKAVLNEQGIKYST